MSGGVCTNCIYLFCIVSCIMISTTMSSPVDPMDGAAETFHEVHHDHPESYSDSPDEVHSDHIESSSDSHDEVQPDHNVESSAGEGSPSLVRAFISNSDLEYSDTENGEVTNSDQQVVYINHGGGAVSTIRRSFVVPFSPHVTSYPSSLYDNPPSTDHHEVAEEQPHDGFVRRAGATEERGYDDSSFDEPNRREHFESAFEDDGKREGYPPSDPPTTPPPSPPPPLGLPVPPTSFGTRTSSNPTGRLNVRNTPPHPSSAPPDPNVRNDNEPLPNNGNNNNNHHNSNTNNRNQNNFNPFVNPFGSQGFGPDFFSLFDAPFSPLTNPAGQDNNFQRRRLSLNNVPDVHSNSIGSGGAAGYPSYNYYTGGEDDASQKWPKIFKFTDGRINLNDFEKDKKLGRVKFSKKDPHFDNIRRDSFLILHGGTYS